MTAAVEAVKSKKMSVNEAAKTISIPKTTVLRKTANKNKVSNRSNYLIGR